MDISDKYTKVIQSLRSIDSEYVPEAVEVIDELEALDVAMRQLASDFEYEYVAEVVKYIPREEVKDLYDEYTTRKEELLNRQANAMNKASELLAKLHERIRQHGKTIEGT